MEFLQENALVVIAVIGGATILFKFAMWMQQVNSDRDVFKDFIKEIREEIKNIHSKIDKIIGRIDNVTISSGSPLHLTELGEKICNEIQARQWAETAAAEFVERVIEKQPYEIQEFCFSYVKEEYEPDPDLSSKIGMAAYENGIDKDGVLDVLAIELRDALIHLVKQSR